MRHWLGACIVVLFEGNARGEWSYTVFFTSVPIALCSALRRTQIADALHLQACWDRRTQTHEPRSRGTATWQVPKNANPSLRPAQQRRWRKDVQPYKGRRYRWRQPAHGAGCKIGPAAIGCQDYSKIANSGVLINFNLAVFFTPTPTLHAGAPAFAGSRSGGWTFRAIRRRTAPGR